MKTNPKRQRQLVIDAIQREIDRRLALIEELRNADRRVIAAAVTCIGSPEGAASWLTRPEYGLRGKVPLEVARTARGRARVLNLLNRLTYGVLA
jgi:uncharacterized protein (DUF2384 family)